MRRGSSGSSTVSTLDIEILSELDRKLCRERTCNLGCSLPVVVRTLQIADCQTQNSPIFSMSQAAAFLGTCVATSQGEVQASYKTKHYVGASCPREIGENSGRVACDSVDGVDGLRGRGARLRAGERRNRRGRRDDAGRRGDGGPHGGDNSAPESPDA